MNKSGLHLTMISIAVILASVGLAAILSGLTPAGGLATPPAVPPSSAQEETATDEPTQAGEAQRPPAQPPAGVLPGGQAEAVLPGRLPGCEEKEVNDDPDRFFYLYNGNVMLESPEGKANIMVENNPGNLCPMQVCYYLEDTEELIYTSAMLKPNQHIEGDVLSKKLKKGSYKVNAVISVYDVDTMKLKTTFHEVVNLTVKQKFLGIFS